jgi:hypothetical protein
LHNPLIHQIPTKVPTTKPGFITLIALVGLGTGAFLIVGNP